MRFEAWTATIIILACLAGCVEREATLAVPSPTTPAAPTESVGTATNISMGLLGPASTNGTSVSYFVNVTGTAAVTLRLNETVFASETLAGNKTWILPLEFGQTSLNVSAESPGATHKENLTLVRLGATSLRIDYCYYHPSSTTARKVHDYTIWIDVDSRPSEPLYKKANGKHIDAFTAHDQLYLFEELTKIPVEVQYFASLQGFAVNKIDRVGNPVTSSAPPYWLYTVNDEDGTGMSLQVLRPGDKVVWALSCAG